MSDSVPSRLDTVVPDPQVAGISQSAGSLSPARVSEADSTDLIQRLTERLQFYESFDALIQQNIARSGQLMREAGEKRDEAVATIVQSRQQIQTERETQRSALTELLDDVMTIQQATERLAHRVSDALEQIEFELEPIGLHETGALGSQSSDRLPTGFGKPASPFQTVAEDVHDEYRLGVIGQPRVGGFAPMAPAVTGESGSNSTGQAISYPTNQPAPSETETDASLFTSNGTVGNPETDADDVTGSPEIDADETGAQVSAEQDYHEGAPGGGAEAAPFEASAGSWVDPAAGPTDEAEPDLTTVVEPYAEAQIPPYGETADPIHSAGLTNTQVPSDSSDAAVGTGSAASDEVIDSTESADLEVGSAFGRSTEPTSENLTSPDDSPIEAPSVDDGADQAAAGQITLATGVDADVVSVTADAEAPRPEPVPLAVAPESESETAIKAAAIASGTVDTVFQPDPEPEPVMAPTEPPREQQTTVVLDGVPRAAVALAIQRHILSKPEVLRAEVREYYDHRLTLFVTGRRATTVDDLQDWDGSATWEQIRTSPELLELRMVL